MNALVNEALAITPATDVAGRIKALDWERVSQDLDAQGCAMIEGLITPEACDALAGLYPVDGIFRSRVVMGRQWLSPRRVKGHRDPEGSNGSRGEAGNVAIVDELGTPLANRLHRWCWPRVIIYARARHRRLSSIGGRQTLNYG